MTSVLRAKSGEAGSMLDWSGMVSASFVVRRSLRGLGAAIVSSGQPLAQLKKTGQRRNNNKYT
jgi:hypothetical protein